MDWPNFTIYHHVYESELLVLADIHCRPPNVLLSHAVKNPVKLIRIILEVKQGGVSWGMTLFALIIKSKTFTGENTLCTIPPGIAFRLYLLLEQPLLTIKDKNLPQNITMYKNVLLSSRCRQHIKHSNACAALSVMSHKTGKFPFLWQPDGRPDESFHFHSTVNSRFICFPWNVWQEN